jgi:hypothetical protein
MKRAVEFPGHKKVNAAIQRHPVMLHQNHMSGCLPSQNASPNNPQTHWRRQRTGEPPPDRRGEWTPESTPPLFSTLPSPTSHTDRAQHSEIVNLPVGYTFSHTVFPCAALFNDDEDTQHETDFDPAMLTDQG